MRRRVGNAEPDLCIAAKRSLFDHLISKREGGRWHGKAERFRGLEVNNKLELCWLHNRHICGVRTLEDLADIFASLAIHPTDAWPVTQKSANHRELAHEIHRWQSIACA